jgi:hypothetical protein
VAKKKTKKQACLSRWIKEGISKGRPRKQAQAIAFSKCGLSKKKKKN